MNNLGKTIIIDYGAGNLKSAANMLSYLGAPYEITSDADKILKADRIIFPGQGHFGQASKSLEKTGLDAVIKKVCSAGVPFLGICAGMQILFESSEEAPDAKGLGIFKGAVKKFTKGRVPLIGWNRVIPDAAEKTIPEAYFYFIHSYYVLPDDDAVISARSTYYEPYCAAVHKDNVTAVQFHPEKSAKAGLLFFKNWFSE